MSTIDSFFNKNSVFPAQAENSYFPIDVSQKNVLVNILKLQLMAILFHYASYPSMTMIALK